MLIKPMITSLSFILYGWAVTSLAQPTEDKRNPKHDWKNPPPQVHYMIDLTQDGTPDWMLETKDPPKECQRWFDEYVLYTIDHKGKTFKEKYTPVRSFPDSHTLWCHGMLFANGVGNHKGESFGLSFDVSTGGGNIEFILGLKDGRFGKFVGEITEKGPGWPGAR